MIPIWHVKNVETTGTQLSVALHYKRMWTSSIIIPAIILNKIKGGINNLNKVITKVTTNVIILITTFRL